MWKFTFTLGAITETFNHANDVITIKEKQATFNEPTAQEWSWCNVTHYLVHNRHGMYIHATQWEGVDDIELKY